MAADISRAIVEACRWQRRLANASIATSYCHIDANPTDPDVWAALLQLVLADHAEGKCSGPLEIGPEISAGMVAGCRAKSGAYKFQLAMCSGAPGAHTIAPIGLGMIEDLFTLPAARPQGVATAMIAACVRRLRAARCQTIFIGALAKEPANHLYAGLGFRRAGHERRGLAAREAKAVLAPSRFL